MCASAPMLCKQSRDLAKAGVAFAIVNHHWRIEYLRVSAAQLRDFLIACPSQRFRPPKITSCQEICGNREKQPSDFDQSCFTVATTSYNAKKCLFGITGFVAVQHTNTVHWSNLALSQGRVISFHTFEEKQKKLGDFEAGAKSEIERLRPGRAFSTKTTITHITHSQPIAEKPVKRSRFAVRFRGISRLRSAFIFLRWFKLAYICVQISALHKG